MQVVMLFWLYNNETQRLSMVDVHYYTILLVGNFAEYLQTNDSMHGEWTI